MKNIVNNDKAINDMESVKKFRVFIKEQASKKCHFNEIQKIN